MFYRLAKKFYDDAVYKRNDADGTLFYYTHEHFKGLRAVPYRFRSSKGHVLCGNFYSYPDPIAHRLVIFDHGLGGGHTAYMKEIEMLAAKGLMVLAYDHTGCMSSQGESTGGFTQSLRDLEDCLTSLSTLQGFENMDISVMGHSWGGYAALNIAAHPKVRRVVAMAGFISVRSIMEQNFKGLLRSAGRRLFDQARAADPELIDRNAMEALKKTEARVLILHSEDDPVVSFADNFEHLKTALEHRPNLTFLRVRRKGHNPNYTEDAVKYKEAFFATYPKEKKKLITDEQKAAFVASVDWDKMTEQDKNVWAHIYKTLEV